MDTLTPYAEKIHIFIYLPFICYLNCHHKKQKPVNEEMGKQFKE